MFYKYWRYYMTLAWHWTWRDGIFYKWLRLSRPSNSSSAPQSFDRNKWRHTPTLTPNYSDWTPITFSAVERFCRFIPNFVLVAPQLLNIKLQKGQLQTFYRLTDEEITALETLMPKLLKPLCWLFHIRLATLLYTRTRTTGGFAVLWYRSNLMEEIDQLGYFFVL